MRGWYVMPLDAHTIRLASGRNFATVVTLMPDDQPQAQLTWVDTDGEHILVNTEPQRQRAKNVARDPRITVLIHSSDDPYDWVEIRGRVVETITGQPARSHIRELFRRYQDSELADCAVGPQGRIILVIAPDKTNAPEQIPGHPTPARS